MREFKYIVFVSTVLSSAVFRPAISQVCSSDMCTFNSDSSDTYGYINPSIDSVSVVSGGSYIISVVNGGVVSVNKDFIIEGDFLHNGRPASVSDSDFFGKGSFSFLGDNATVATQMLKIDGNLVNGDGNLSWNLALAVDTIGIKKTFTAATNSNLVINPEFANTSSLTAGAIYIEGDLYMGAANSGVVNIASNSDKNVYTIKTSGTFDITGNVESETGRLVINAGDIQVGKNLLGDDWSISADKLKVSGSIIGTGNISANAVDVVGTYYFNDDSYLQLVLNSSNVPSMAYDPDTADALMKVGGFDASAITRSPDFISMNNIEILVDNLSGTIGKIKLVEITGQAGVVDLGLLDFADMWFYWDTDGDGKNDTRLFQETILSVDNNYIYATVPKMNSIERLVAANAASNGNDMQMAAAADDLIVARLRRYSGYAGGGMDNYYTSVMRVLFPGNDVYYDLMLNSGTPNDAVKVMVLQSPARALELARALGLDSASDIGGKLALSTRVSRNAVSDQLLEDFIWRRDYDKNAAWLRASFGGDIMSFNMGADKKIKKFRVGANLGYNSLYFDGLSGYTLSLGGYGAYDLNDIVRLYATANLAFHSAGADVNSSFTGLTASDLSAVDTALDIGALHKISAPYLTDRGYILTGRGYMTLGRQSGYNMTMQYKGMNFMDIQGESKIILAPGYEVLLGRDIKDIWFGTEGFARPSLRLGMEYDFPGDGARNLNFKFSEVGNWRGWEARSGLPLWLRFGVQIDFSFIDNMDFSLGYEILSNGNFTANQFKMNGTYKF